MAQIISLALLVNAALLVSSYEVKMGKVGRNLEYLVMPKSAYNLGLSHFATGGLAFPSSQNAYRLMDGMSIPMARLIPQNTGLTVDKSDNIWSMNDMQSLISSAPLGYNHNMGKNWKYLGTWKQAAPLIAQQLQHQRKAQYAQQQQLNIGNYANYDNLNAPQIAGNRVNFVQNPISWSAAPQQYASSFQEPLRNVQQQIQTFQLPQSSQQQQLRHIATVQNVQEPLKIKKFLRQGGQLHLQSVSPLNVRTIVQAPQQQQFFDRQIPQSQQFQQQFQQFENVQEPLNFQKTLQAPFHLQNTAQAPLNFQNFAQGSFEQISGPQVTMFRVPKSFNKLNIPTFQSAGQIPLQHSTLNYKDLSNAPKIELAGGHVPITDYQDLPNGPKIEIIGQRTLAPTSLAEINQYKADDMFDVKPSDIPKNLVIKAGKALS